MSPVYLEETRYTPVEFSLILQVLEKKSLIELDYSVPLKGFDMSAYQGCRVHGTVSLTARGQTVIDLLDKQGIG